MPGDTEPVGLIFTSNPGSKYGDITGVSYEYPPMYRFQIQPGRRFIYYRSRTPDSDPVYFGAGIVGDVRSSTQTPGWFECDILDYTPFEQPIPFKTTDGEYLEPGGNRRGYYQRGARQVPEVVLDRILGEGSLTAPEIGPVVAGGAARRRPYASSDLSRRVEAYAIEVAKGEVRGRFPTAEVRVMPHNNPGFDIEVRDGGEVVRYVEVKGTSSVIPGFLLTEGERRHSTRFADRSSLVVIVGIDVEQRTHAAIHWHNGEIDQGAFALEPERWHGRVFVFDPERRSGVEREPQEAQVGTAVESRFAEKYLFEWHEWPATLQARNSELGLLGRAALQGGDFLRAARIFEAQFRLLLDAQPFRRRIHKGESLHNWGLSLIFGGDRQAALRETLAAYIEDAASGAENSPGRQDELDASAAHNLVYVFGLFGPAVARIGQQVRSIILDGQELPDPHALLADPAVAAASVPAPTERPPRTIGSLTSPVERRVFIGGNYGRLRSTLWPLADRLAPDYDGLLAADFPTPEGWGMDETMVPLLTSSQFAIFEVSENGGQVEEISKTPDTMRTSRRMLGVFDATEMDKPGISNGQTLEKFRRWGIDCRGYTSVDELEAIVREWLAANDPTNRS